MVEESKFKCPLCNSPLTESRYYEVVGVLEEKKKFEEDLKKQLSVAKETKEKLLKEKKELNEKLAKEKEEIKKRFESQFEKQKLNILRKSHEEKKKIEDNLKKQLLIVKENEEKFTKERKNIQEKSIKERLEIKNKFEAQFEKQKLDILGKAQEEAKKLAQKDIDKLKKEKIEVEKRNKQEILKVQKEFLEKGKEHEKKRTERLSESLNLKTEDWKRAMEQIKVLKEQLKKGTTPQLEGINLEHELVKELQNKFPHDKIEHHGKTGDILHYIVCEGKDIALIVYECKKTQKFNKSYITQIKNDVIKRNANYGVLVTLASDKNQSQFWVEKDILIVHPYGAPYIAEVLRKSLIQLYALKLSDKDLSERAKKLLEYIKGNKFRNSVKDNITRAKELYELLNKEVEYHKTIWEKRHEHYNSIAKQSKEIEEDSKQIVGEDLGEEILESPIIELTPRRRKKKIMQVF